MSNLAQNNKNIGSLTLRDIGNRENKKKQIKSTTSKQKETFQNQNKLQYVNNIKYIKLVANSNTENHTQTYTQITLSYKRREKTQKKIFIYIHE